ncbi:sensor histidine kinase [Bombilactobacillus bombi]|uniref:sensor histidine kinase n=1 Tax=Bombilactobacillus bombi TaxID=1303590 RepID=UPI0015E5AF25|nr:sensor histidine kinase [Bombilactobacillus bombi]MBA1434908.1 sensor histidine kinase [Bombilactobacillus bombi]
MNFIRKYILFPRRFGFSPYLWLLWLLLPLAQLFPYRQLQDWIALMLLIIFVWFYRNSWTVTAWESFWLIGQYLITLILIYLQGMFSLFLFTAWVVGSLPISKAKFKRYLLIYYLAVAWGILLVFSQGYLVKNYWNGVEIVLFLFIVLSPFGGRSVRNTYLRSGILKQQNKRYEMLIRRGERERIARDLHDNLGQVFATITLKAELAQKLLNKKPAAVHQQLAEIQATARDNLSLVREIVTDLRQITLTEALVNLTDKLAGLKISLWTSQEELAQQWPLAVQETIAAILQEAMTNVMQYSQANTVWVTFAQTHQQALVTITDDGKGFKQVRTGAHGIMGMKERTQQLQGEFLITSNHQGTTIKLTLPLKE